VTEALRVRRLEEGVVARPGDQCRLVELPQPVSGLVRVVRGQPSDDAFEVSLDARGGYAREQVGVFGLRSIGRMTSRSKANGSRRGARRRIGSISSFIAPGMAAAGLNIGTRR
jgi:hypothetical protein